MAKPTTNTAEVQMMKKKAFEKGSENLAAALDQLETASSSIDKSTGIVKRRLEELDELLSEYEARLRDAEVIHEREVQEMRDKYTRDTTTLQTKLTAAEEKLRKVQATLA